MDATRLPPPAAAAPAPVPSAPPAGLAGDAAATVIDSGAQAIAGRFLVLGGAGQATATGQLHEARDANQGGQVVHLKLVKPQVLPTAAMADRALRELKQLAKVASERIVKVIDQGKTSDGTVYVATEAVAGPSLEELVTREGPLPIERATAIVLQIGEALTEAQKVGVIHRDVSPRNVFVAGDKVKVGEFGLAEPVNEKVFGAPAFLSPEQVEGKSVDQRSNIYSLGAIFYFALTGQAPFTGEPDALLSQQLSATPQAPSAKRAGLSAEIDRIILKALEKSGGRRHLTLRQLLSEIEGAQALAGKAQAAPPKDDVSSAKTMMGFAAPVVTQQSPAKAADSTVMGVRGGTAASVPAATTSPGVPAGTTTPSMAAAPATAPSLAAAPATTTPSMAAAPSTVPSMAAVPPAAEPPPVAVPEARTMMAEAPKIAVPEARTMMAEAPKLPLQPPPAAPPPAAAAPVAAAPVAAAAAPGKPIQASEKVQQAVAAAQAQVAAQKAAAAPPAKGGFRETAWFKAGEIQEELQKAQAQAAQSAGGDVLAPAGTTGNHRAVVDGEVDVNKIDVDAQDRARLSLKTGATQMMAAVQMPKEVVKGERMDEEEMLAEIDNSKKWFIVAGAIVGVVILAAVLYFVLGGKKDEPKKAEVPRAAPEAVAAAPPATGAPTAAAPTPSPPGPPATPPPAAPPPVAAAPATPPAPLSPAASPPAESPAQMLAEADAATAKDNLALAVDLLTRASAAGADPKAQKRTELRLEKAVQRKLLVARKKKDREGLAEAQALSARLRSLKTARKR